MKPFIIIFTAILLSIVSFFEKNNKLLLLIIVIFMIVIYTGCIGGTPDLGFDKEMLELGLTGRSLAWDLIIKLSHSVGMNFQFFKFLLSFLVVGLSIIFIKNMTEYPTFVLGFLLIFPFFSAVAQLRNGLMAPIVLLLVSKYLYSGKKWTIKFCILVCLTCTIHLTAIFYLIVVIAFIKINKKELLALSLLIGLVIYIFINRNLLLSIVSYFVSDMRVLMHFDFSRSNELNWKGKLLPVVGQCLLTLIFMYNLRLLKHQINKIDMDSLGPFVKRKKVLSINQIDVLERVLIVCLAIMPLYLESSTFFRFFRNLLPLYYIPVAQLFSVNKVSRVSSRILYQSCFLLFVAVLSTVIIIAISQGFFIETLDSFSLFR